MTDRIHNIGDCVDPSYGGDWCSGIGSWDSDPYASEIYGDDSDVFMCDGARMGAAEDV